KRGEAQVRKVLGRRRPRAAVGRALVGVAVFGKWRNHQGEIAAAEPAPRRIAHRGRGGGGDQFELLAEAAGVVLVGVAGGQQVGLAAKTADTLDAARKTRALHGLGAFEFRRRGTQLNQALEFLV